MLKNTMNGMDELFESDNNIAGLENINNVGSEKPLKEPNKNTPPPASPPYKENMTLDPLATNYPFLYIHTTTKADGNKKYIVNLLDCVDHYRKPFYVPLFTLMETAPEGTDIDIRINTPGGSVQLGSVFSSLMLKTKANVKVIVVNCCYSIGTCFFSKAHEQEIRDGSDFLFHMSSHGDRGFSTSIKERAQYIIEYMRDYILDDSLKKGHILKEEFEDMFNDNKTIIVSDEEMRKRIGSKVVVANEDIDDIVNTVDTLGSVTNIEGIEEKNSERDEYGLVAGFESFISLDDLHKRNNASNSDPRAYDIIRNDHMAKVKASVDYGNKAMFTNAVAHDSTLLSLEAVQQMYGGFESGTPVSIVRSEKERNLYINSGDAWWDKYVNNLFNYLEYLDDDVTINIYTWASLWTTSHIFKTELLPIIHLLRDIPNRTIGKAYGMLDVDETIIHLYCKEIEIDRMTSFTFGQVYGVVRYENERDYKAYTETYYKPLVEKGALLQEELDLLIKTPESNKEIHVSGEEMLKRLKMA